MVVLQFLIGTKVGRILCAVVLIAGGWFGFKAWLVAHDAGIRKEALRGYVQQAQLDVAKAKLAEMQRQKNVAETAAADFEKRRLDDLRAQSAEDAQKDREYEADLEKAGNAWRLSQPDIDYLLR